MRGEKGRREREKCCSDWRERKRTAASMLAGDSSLGSENREMTDMRICSTPRMGRHLSSAVSWKRRRTRKKKGKKTPDEAVDKQCPGDVPTHHLVELIDTRGVKDGDTYLPIGIDWLR